MIQPDYDKFCKLARTCNLIPVYRRIFSDQLTPVLAYRRLVAEDDRKAPSFLLESVEQGDRQGRYSFVGAQPIIELKVIGQDITIIDHHTGQTAIQQKDDPLEEARLLSENWKPVIIPGMPDCFTGGWVGYIGYDTVRYVEKGKLPFSQAPIDDRNLADIHLGLYKQVAVFDHVNKTVFVINWVMLDDYDTVEEAYQTGVNQLQIYVDRLQTHSVPLPAGSIDLSLKSQGEIPAISNMTKLEFTAAVEQAKEYILAGDIFQVVLSQRFERTATSDPFEIYRALRIVNPSPYMIYLQAEGVIFVASSPEILCRVHNGKVVNRPLAGTRKRGTTFEEDQELEKDLLSDAKELSEHIMLVDLGRNDVGKIAESRSVTLEKIMQIEHYSHVMHISSTVTGQLAKGSVCWDALRAALPVGTVSGAPKVRAMQIIDQLEPTRRGPYGGGIGVISFTGNMDIALALRTMVIPTTQAYLNSNSENHNKWTIHIQAGAGIVADSVPENEYQETVNKAAALGRAIDLAESAFSSNT